MSEFDMMVDQGKVSAYLTARQDFDARTKPSALALWLLSVINRIFKTKFGEIPDGLWDQYLAECVVGHAEDQARPRLNTLEKIAAGVRSGQFYAPYFADEHRLSGFTKLQDWPDDVQYAYREHWYKVDDSRPSNVRRGPIAGDVSKYQLTPAEQVELNRMRELRSQAGFGERVQLYWHLKE